jgi:hypothetical protein
MTLEELHKLTPLSEQDLSSLSVRRKGTPGQKVGPGELVTAVIQVADANYVPEGVFVSARVNSKLFTGKLPEHALNKLQKDPKVKKVSECRPQQFGV